MNNDPNDDKDSREPRLKLYFSPNSEDRSSPLPTLEGFQAVFHDVGGESYSCENNKLQLWDPTPEIRVTSELRGEEAERPRRIFPPEKASLNGGPCYYIEAKTSFHSCLPSSGRSSPTSLRRIEWTPREGHLIVPEESSTKMKQMIFYLFNSVCLGDSSPNSRYPGRSISDFLPSGSSAFEHEEWSVKISACEQSPKYIYKGCIQRKDGKPFDGEEGKKCLETLDYIFSFIKKEDRPR